MVTENNHPYYDAYLAAVAQQLEYPPEMINQIEERILAVAKEFMSRCPTVILGIRNIDFWTMKQNRGRHQVYTEASRLLAKEELDYFLSGIRLGQILPGLGSFAYLELRSAISQAIIDQTLQNSLPMRVDEFAMMLDGYLPTESDIQEKDAT